MKYIFHNFLNTLRRYRVSSLLNVVGMAVAFGTFYVILTQVSFDFGYNRSLKDADRTFIISTPSNYTAGKYSTYLCRPLGEALVNGSPEVECGGMIAIWAGEPQVCWTRRDGEVRKLHLNTLNYSAGGLKTMNFEAAEGSMEELSKIGTLAVSESYAKKNGIGIGDRISWRDPEGEKGAYEVVAIYRDFPGNSDLGAIEAVSDMGDHNIDDPQEWSYEYAVLPEKTEQEKTCSRTRYTPSRDGPAVRWSAWMQARFRKRSSKANSSAM